MRRLVLVLVLGGLACSSSVEPVPCTAELDRSGDQCVPHFDACGDAELPLQGGGCRPVGVPPGACGKGFTSDGRAGCAPILPATPCPSGLLAVPGDAVCREVADCGTDPYGAAPTDASTVYVDAAYAGGGSTGSREKPFTTIQAGVDAAPNSAVVAVAAGTYAENVTVTRSVKLHGRCPKLVEIAALDPKKPALELRATGEVHTLATKGSMVRVLSAKGVLLDRLWVHDSGFDGVQIGLGAEATVRGALLERNVDVGIVLIDAAATIEQVVVRDALLGSSGGGQLLSALGKSSATVRGSLFERFQGIGIRGDQADLVIEDSVIRDAVSPSSVSAGALDVNGGSSTPPYKPFALRRSLVSGARGGAAIRLSLVDAQIEHTVVRDVEGANGGVFSLTGALAVRASLVEGVESYGVWGYDGQVSLDDLLVRDVRERGFDHTFGFGVGAFGATAGRASLALRTSVIRGCHYAGAFLSGADATVENVFVEGILPRSDGAYGDGMAISAIRSSGVPLPSTATVRRLHVVHAARAGLSVFGSTLSLSSSVLACSEFDLDAETAFVDVFGGTGNAPFTFSDGGDNHCGCGAVEPRCVVRQSNLTPLTVPKPP
ncbi:MAG: hypothetical protein IPJ34_42700 [Myxococcales bacterium]|nr:hypothetical protein [Myxococcales bacterium]